MFALCLLFFRLFPVRSKEPSTLRRTEFWGQNSKFTENIEMPVENYFEW